MKKMTTTIITVTIPPDRLVALVEAANPEVKGLELRNIDGSVTRGVALYFRGEQDVDVPDDATQAENASGQALAALQASTPDTWKPTQEQREEARVALIDRASFISLDVGQQIGAVTDLLDAWHKFTGTGVDTKIREFAWPWFKTSKYYTPTVTL